MKVIKKLDNFYIVRFDLDEEVISEIMDFCAKQMIRSSFFSGIGAGKKAVISYYDLDEKNI